MGGYKKNRKVNNGNKLSNKGFTLIEVLVAMAILAVLSLPILSNFSSAAKVNALARKTENANTAAQKVTERFKSMNLEQLLANGMEPGTTYDIYGKSLGQNSGIYRYKVEMAAQSMAVDDFGYDENLKTFTFQMADYENGNALQENGNPYILGTNGEHFFVKVTLNPADYSDNVAQNKDGQSNNAENNVNSYEMPNFQDINMNNNFVIREEIYKYDSTIQTVLHTQLSNIKKTVNIYSTISSEPGATPKFKQTLQVEVVYTDRNDSSNQATYRFEVKMDQIVTNVEPTKNVYLFYGMFDKHRVMTDNCESDSWYADDEINIYYSYPGSYSWMDDNGKADVDKMLKVFIIEQETKNTANTAMKMRLKKSNVKIYITNSPDFSGALVPINYGNGYNGSIGMEASGATGHGPVSVFSNMYAWNQNPTAYNSKNNITQVYDNQLTKIGKKLYSIDVTVSIDEPDNVIYSITSTKEN